MTEDSSDELEMILEYDEEEVRSSDHGIESEDEGELGEFKDNDEIVNADRIVMREFKLQPLQEAPSRSSTGA